MVVSATTWKEVMVMPAHGNKLDCTYEELLSVAPGAWCYSERSSGSSVAKVHINLLMPRNTQNKFNFYAGTVTCVEATAILNAFDPSGSIRRASSSQRTAEPTYYRPQVLRG